MSVSKERRIIFFFCLISHKLLIGDKMKDDIVLNPFTMSLELENEIKKEKGNPIPFNLIEIDKLHEITYDSDKQYFHIHHPGDYYISYQMKTEKRYRMDVKGEVKYFEADLFPVEKMSHGSGIITTTKNDMMFYITCLQHDIFFQKGKQATITIFKVR